MSYSNGFDPYGLENHYTSGLCKHCKAITSLSYIWSDDDDDSDNGSMCCIKCYKLRMDKCYMCNKEIYDGNNNVCEICCKHLCNNCMVSTESFYDKTAKICIDPVCITQYNKNCMGYGMSDYDYKEYIWDNKDITISCLEKKITKLQQRIAEIKTILDNNRSD